MHKLGVCVKSLQLSLVASLDSAGCNSIIYSFLFNSINPLQGLRDLFDIELFILHYILY
jgi:hypothetical protein